MPQSTLVIFSALAGLSAAASVQSLAEVCTVENVQAALPANNTLLGIEPIASSVTANAVVNATTSGSGMMRRSTSAGTLTYCNVTVTYTHTGKDDKVVVQYAFPQPSDFQKRFYVAGGFAYELPSSTTGGLTYGAIGGITDAGYDAFTTSYDAVNLKGNGSINWDATYMFAYQGIGEMTSMGKAMANPFYGNNNGTKIYTYFEGCSDGGRQGMSQVQRWGEEYDGAVIGAPAMRYAQQQVGHLTSVAVEHTMDHYPPPCSMAKIVNATIAACDPLDGRTDGVISRTDLCKLHFDLDTLVGESYYCAATTSSSLGFGFGKRDAVAGSSTSTTPAQNGTVTAADVAVVKGIYNGLHNLKGERAYISWQHGSEVSTDADPTWNNNTSSWELNIPSTGGEFVTRFVELIEEDNLSTLDGVTYDTIVDWMQTAFVRYMDSLQTTLPDLTPFQKSGGKLLHYHGESDPSVPPASSVHYWQSVRSIMYPESSYSHEQSLQALQDWYQFYLVPGAAHCAANSLQPDGPFPEDNMATMIDWVENGTKPTGLNATVSAGQYSGEVQKLCQWPTRPVWKNDAWKCVNDQASIDSWTYTFPAFKVPVY
ncbi:Tannase 30 kDa subunit [Aureobasidium pullulans]|nr:Tannase 30 kDa subunit [Aureobasidium pullulans]